MWASECLFRQRLTSAVGCSRRACADLFRELCIRQLGWITRVPGRLCLGHQPPRDPNDQPPAKHPHAPPDSD